jgi:phage baseplate assembly protein W
MAANEKSLYKNITVSGLGKDRSPVVSKQYRGISTVANPNGFNLYDIQLIKQDIINHFHIRQGEKLSDPTFGTIIWDILFEPFTDDLKQLIIEDITEIINYDPRVSVNSIIVDSYESGIQIDCSLTYLPYSISESMRIKFDQTNGLI